jgi:ArsR family transcriptional regulator, arsenate/arsenite/antimonite-responsive transcriptional repressor / arsenate reductase (thioredoxin)
MHAALGEPVRLAIADTLSLRDAAPKELAAAFDLQTNLLAHHLSVMEDAGLVLRRRSEGDARRTYVHLKVEDPIVSSLVGVISLDSASAGSRVVFVCTHNSARSQLAAAEWERVSAVPAVSAGTHPAQRVHGRAIAAGRRHKLALGRRRTAHIDDVLSDDDLVVAVCDQAHEEITASGYSGNELHWSIPDPVRIDTDEAFEDAFVEISGRVRRLAASVRDAT